MERGAEWLNKALVSQHGCVDSWCHYRLFRGPSTPQGKVKLESLGFQLSATPQMLLPANSQLISGRWCSETSSASNPRRGLSENCLDQVHMLDLG